MRERVVTGIIGIPLLLVCCYVGSWLLALLCAVLAVLAAYELNELFLRRSFAVSFPLDTLATLLLTWTFGLISGMVWPFAVTTLLTVAAYIFLARYRKGSLTAGLIRACATLYVGVGFGALLALRLGQADWRWILTAFFNVWITDSAAHLAGSRYGRLKLAPLISPNKTWEGAGAGLVCATLICGIYICLALHVPFFTSLALALLFSVAAQLGDLGESALKRWAGVKDSGHILPGHGGVLDRFDSLLISAPLVLWLLSSVSVGNL